MEEGSIEVDLYENRGIDVVGLIQIQQENEGWIRKKMLRVQSIGKCWHT
jgi:hypothetical protein